jgi:hypothetical protein
MVTLLAPGAKNGFLSGLEYEYRNLLCSIVLPVVFNEWLVTQLMFGGHPLLENTFVLTWTSQ